MISTSFESANTSSYLNVSISGRASASAHAPASARARASARATVRFPAWATTRTCVSAHAWSSAGWRGGGDGGSGGIRSVGIDAGGGCRGQSCDNVVGESGRGGGVGGGCRSARLCLCAILYAYVSDFVRIILSLLVKWGGYVGWWLCWAVVSWAVIVEVVDRKHRAKSF